MTMTSSEPSSCLIGIPDVSLEVKAGLEFAYLDVLARSFRGGDEHHIPNLERYIEDHPEMFVQAIVWTYKRKTPSEDPPEFRAGEGREHLANKGYRLLEGSGTHTRTG